MDCDDGDPTVFPGAPDWCDGVDQDCDGHPVGSGMCGKWATVADMGLSYWQGEYAGEGFSGGPYGTFDGTVLNRGRFAHEQDGVWAWTLFQGVPGADHRWSGGLVCSWRGRPGANEVEHVTAAGDFDGDGSDDLWVLTGDWDHPRADYRLQLGPWTGWPSDGVYGDEVDEAVWSETDAENLTIDSSGSAGRDLDGDGLADSVHFVEDRIILVRGRADPAGNHSMLDEPWLAVSAADDVYAAFPMADADGDGVLDVIVGQQGYDHPHGLAWLPGAALATAAGEEVAAFWSELPSSDNWLGISRGYGADAGDLDGDGVSDIVASSRNDTGGEVGCFRWLSAAALPTAATVEDAELARACWLAEGEESETYVGSGDIDGDGVLDPRFVVSDHDVYVDRGWYQVGCPLGTTRLELGGTLDASTVSPCYYGYGGTAPDLDGDGLDDHVAYNMEWLAADTDNYGRTDLLLGFEIPWDDPSKW